MMILLTVKFESSFLLLFSGLLIFFYLDVTTGNFGIENQCPVSSLLTNPKKDGYFSYPVSLFDTYDVLKNLASNDVKDLYHCSSLEIHFDKKHLPKPEATNHYCAPFTHCPLQQDNFESFISTTLTAAQVKICPFIRALNRSNNDTAINVIVLGGSVALGVYTPGCCCQEDVKCPSDNFCEFLSYDGDHISTHCNWGAWLGRWIHKVFPNANVKIVNLAISGAASAIMADEILPLLKKERITLSSNDVVFLDHSANDLVPNDFYRDGVEILIRKILNSNRASCPTVIMLYTTSQGNPHFLDTYLKLTRHYEMHYWSFDKVSQTTFAKTQQKSIYPYLTYMQSGYGLHPPWYIHLMWADLIASAINNASDICSQNGWLSQEPAPAVETPLPPSLFAGEESIHVCSGIENSVVLDIRATDSYAGNIRNETIGSVTAEHWKLLEDRPHKFGWVSEGSSDADFDKDLTFNFDDVKFGSFNFSTAFVMQVKLHFLKTYLNAGSAEVFMCGHLQGTIDALWKDYEFYHISEPQVFSVSVLYDPAKADADYPCKQMRIVRRRSTNNLEARTANQKLKVIRAHACRRS